MYPVTEQSPKIYEAQTDKIIKRYRQSNNNSWRLQYLIFNTGQNN